MRKLNPFMATIAIAILAFIQTGFGQQTNIYPLTGSVGFGTTKPTTSALLEMKSTTQGFLMPRMSKVKRDSIASPVPGLLIYQNNSNPGFYYYSGSVWIPISTGGTAWQINGNAGTSSANFLGTTDAHSLTFKVNNIFTGILDLSGNVGFGPKAISSNTSGYSNVAIGSHALLSNTNIPNLVAVGDSALYNNGIGASRYFDGNANTAIGSKALLSNTIGSYNTASGFNALYSNTDGTQNVATGAKALYFNKHGSFNTANGPFALYLNVSGSQNTATGTAALYSNQADNNTADGQSALATNTTGDLNTAVGYNALALNQNGYRNTAIGATSLQSNTIGIYNTAVGNAASGSSTEGNYNTAIGAFTLLNNSTGPGNTVLGYGADLSGTDFGFSIAIGYGTISNASGKAVIGDGNVDVIGGPVGWSTLSDARFKSNVRDNVPGLIFINKLKPVTYNIQLEKFDKFLGKKDSMINSAKPNYAVAERKIHTGFIAQDVEKTSQSIGYDFDGINHPKSDKDNYSLVYADFVPSLVKAVQELSKANDNKDTVIQEQNNKIIDLESRLAKLEAMMNVQSTGSNQQVTSITNTTLEQNIPNPFNHTTVINYILPQHYSSAKIVVANKAGAVLKQITVAGNGKGSVSIDASTLNAGAYSYSLYIDGKLIGTKQMVLAK